MTSVVPLLTLPTQAACVEDPVADLFTKLQDFQFFKEYMASNQTLHVAYDSYYTLIGREIDRGECDRLVLLLEGMRQRGGFSLSCMTNFFGNLLRSHPQWDHVEPIVAAMNLSSFGHEGFVSTLLLAAFYHHRGFYNAIVKQAPAIDIQRSSVSTELSYALERFGGVDALFQSYQLFDLVEEICEVKKQLDAKMQMHFAERKYPFLFRKDSLRAYHSTEDKALRNKLKTLIATALMHRRQNSLSKQLPALEETTKTSITLHKRSYDIYRYYSQARRDVYHCNNQIPASINYSNARTDVVSDDNKPIYFQGAECEILEDWTLCYAQGGLREARVYARTDQLVDSYWDDWQHHDARKIYSSIFHPIICEAVKKALELSVLPTTHVSFLELGGGDGVLARQLLDILPEDTSYVLLEKNSTLLAKAKESLQAKAEYLQADILLDMLPEGPFSCIIGSGIFTQQVLPSKARNGALLERVYNALKPGGLLILTGFAPSLYHKEDFVNQGFEVLNCTFPGYPKSLHILKK